MQAAPTVNPYAQGIDFSNRTMEEVFPTVDPQFKPYASKVLIQLRRVMNESKGGIILPTETKATDAWNMQVGKVIAIGPLAFKNRKTGEEWPEGAWCKVGEYVRFSRYIGDRMSIPMNDGKGDDVSLLILDDHHLLGQYMGDPRDVRAFIE